MPVDPLAIDWQRARLDDARRDLARALLARSDAKDRVDALSRDASRQSEAALARARAAVATAEQAAAAANRRIKVEGTGLRGDLLQHVEVTPEDEVARLRADLPIVLMPVRIETRFAGAELLLRVYPDDLFADTHEPELTDVEIADGQAFWTAAWPGEAAERAAWKTLVDAVGVPRAGWIAQVMTPTNIADRPAGAPVIPAPARRTSAWTRAAEARLLPDRWMVRRYRAGAEIGEAVVGPAIVEPLALTFSPATADGDRSPLGDDGLAIDDAVRWTVDFGEAEKVGMGLRIPLDAADRAAGFDRVLVMGVKSSLAPDRSALELAALFENHRHGRGIAIVPQGTPTNNSSAAPTPYPPPDPDGQASFQAERAGLAVTAAHDGGRLTRALGLPLSAAAHVMGATGNGDAPASNMARALWPVTLGYFLEQLMAPVFSPSIIADVRRFFVQRVRGRGPLPAFRIGNTPYGVLPVAALDRWQPENRKSALDRELPPLLRSLRAVWAAHVGEVPRAGRTADPDADLLGILGMDASTREARIRPVIGEDVQWNLFGLFGLPEAWQVWFDEGQRMAALAFARIGHPGLSPRVARLNFGQAAMFRYALVADAPLSEEQGLVPNYVDWIARASVQALRAEQWPGPDPKPTSLLYRLLRHAALLEYHDAAFTLLLRHERAREADRRESELVGLPAQARVPTRMERLEQPLPAVSGAQPLQTFLAEPANRALLRSLFPDGAVVDLRDALAALAPVPAAELERLFSETLDVASHRLDAWITALAAKRLDGMRQARAEGCHLGAFGWVEDLRPKPPAPTVRLADGRTAQRPLDNGGYVQAPSMTHAAAAAVLRNAYLSRSGPDQERYAVDLSSARVRMARFVLDAVREGQPLGAVLGYQIERRLHERNQDVLIAPLRSLYPLVAGKANDPADANEPAESIAARNVVDGLALRTAFQKGEIPWGSQGLPAGGARRTALEEELAALDFTTDATADLLLAESVYQLVKGSPSVAAATLDAMAQGVVRPPDPEIATQPRTGTPLTHRVALVLGESAAPLPAGWPAAPTPRAALEPMVDAWVGGIIGDPTAVTCAVEIGPAAAPAGNTDVALDELGLRPIDLLALSLAAAEHDPAAARAGAAELDRRIQDVAYAKLGVAQDTETRIRYELAPGADRSVDRGFGDVLALIREVGALMGRSRPLRPADLVAEDRGADAAAADLLPAATLARASVYRDGLAQLRTAMLAPAVAAAKVAAPDAAFDLTALRAALRAAASAGIGNAYPLTGAGNTLPQRLDLIGQGESVAPELARRVERGTAILDDAAAAAHAADPDYQVKAAIRAVEALAGGNTPFLPRFKPPAAAELSNALSWATQAAFIDADSGERLRAIRRFAMVAARVRPALDAWRRVDLLRGAFGGAAAAPIVAQLPYENGARWAALPFANDASRPKPGRTSVLLYRAAAPAVNASWCGLLMDQWTEVIPQRSEQTGVAFHYDDAGAEAPQAILVAVPPAPAEQWDLASLVATVNEALDLAKVRAVDMELLGELGQLLPAAYLSDSTEDVTVRSSFQGALALERAIAAAVEG